LYTCIIIIHGSQEPNACLKVKITLQTPINYACLQALVNNHAKPTVVLWHNTIENIQNLFVQVCNENMAVTQGCYVQVCKRVIFCVA